MDPTLSQRLAIYDSDATVPAGVMDFVRAELNLIDPEQSLTDEEIGFFVSHLTMALARLITGAEIEVDLDDDTYAEVVAEHPDTPAAAQALASRVSQKFNVQPPEPEVKFLTVHLALIAAKSSGDK